MIHDREVLQKKLDAVETEIARALHHVGHRTLVIRECQDDIDTAHAQVKRLRAQAAELRTLLEHKP